MSGLKPLARRLMRARRTEARVVRPRSPVEWFYREIGFEDCCNSPRSPALWRLASPAQAATEIMWWHAMSGELGKQLEKLAADFNASQSEYRIVPTYKGNYTETVTAAIFAFRSRSQPAIVQVNEIATATMMAAQGRDLSGVRIDARSGGAVLAGRLSAGRHRLLLRHRRQHAVVPVQRLDADPLLQQGPVPRRRPRSRSGAEDLARGWRCGEAAARGGRRLRLHHVLAVLDQCREFFRLPQSAARDQGQRLWRARRRTDLQQSARGAPHRAARGMADHESVRL